MYSRHVDADERLAVGEQELGQRARQLGLPDAGRAAEDERADRPLRVLEARAAPPDGAGDRLDGLVLAHHGLVDLVLHAEQAAGLGLLQPRDGNAGPAGHDERDVLLVDDRAAAPAAPPPTPPAGPGSGSAARAPSRGARPRARSSGRGSPLPSPVHLLQLALSSSTSAGGTCDAIRARAPASSMTSMALSGRKRSVM